MIKDLSKSLVDAVSAINQKSREAWVAEQAAMKKPKLPGVPAPKADPAAVSSAKKMAEEAGGTVPKTEKEKKLAALANDGKKNVITHADVMAGRGVRKEEKEESAAHEKAEKKGNNPFDWKNFKSGMAKKPGEMTGHDSKKISTGTVFTKKVVTEAKVGENEHVKVTHTSGDREDVYTVHDKKTGTKNKYGIHGYFDAAKEKPQDTIKKQLKQHNVPSAAHDMIVKHMTEEVTGNVDEGFMSTLKKISQKAVKAVSHGSDEDMIKDLQKKVGVPQTGKKPVKEDVEPINEYFDKEHIGSSKSYDVHSVDPENGHYTATHKKTGKQHDVYIDDKFPNNTHSSVHGDVKHYMKGTDAFGESSEIAKHITKHISSGQSEYKKDVKENMDTPGNSTHQCAIHVKSEQFGEGRTLFSQHAEPDADGNIAWYDVMFAEGIKRVETKDIEVLVSEGHMDHKKKKAK